MIQIIIFICSASAIWLVGRKESWRVWGYVFGVVGQPFWLYSTIVNKQWGIFCLCLWYTYSWAAGLYNHLPGKGSKKFRSLLEIVRITWRFLVWKIWYYFLLGRRRAIRVEEDCSYFLNKESTKEKFLSECEGDGHYLCKECVHYEFHE